MRKISVCLSVSHSRQHYWTDWNGNLETFMDWTFAWKFGLNIAKYVHSGFWVFCLSVWTKARCKLKSKRTESRTAASREYLDPSQRLPNWYVLHISYEHNCNVIVHIVTVYQSGSPRCLQQLQCRHQWKSK